jgi:porin
MQRRIRTLTERTARGSVAPALEILVRTMLRGEAGRLGIAASLFSIFAIACAHAQDANQPAQAQSGTQGSSQPAQSAKSGTQDASQSAKGAQSGTQDVSTPVQDSSSGTQDTSQPVQATTSNTQDANGGEPSFFTGLFAPSRSYLLNDMGGLRTAIGKYGLTFSLQDINEVFGNATGGIRQGVIYDGLTTMTLGLDTQRAFGWEGGTANISAFQIRGGNLTDNLLDLQTYSGISAAPTTRLWEMWYQQVFLGGKMDVKVGQQSLDQEFIVSQGSSLFINTMMGWPMVPSADLYAGGPAYPLSALGVRLRSNPVGPLTLLAGVFQDNPPGGPFNDDSQLRGSAAWGGNFLNVASTGALFITEAQYSINQPSSGDIDAGKRTGGLPGTYKIGAWFDTAEFPNQRFDNTGLSLANPASTGVPQMEDTDFSIYAVADQMIWQPSADSTQSLNVFTRVMGAPDDRNLVSLSANSGVTLKAPFQGRDNDTAGLGFGVARVSSYASGLALDEGLSTIPSVETFIEATYQYQVAPWWQVQPDFQYVFRPSGGIPNPNNPNIRVGDESVFGLRSIVTF